MWKNTHTHTYNSLECSNRWTQLNFNRPDQRRTLSFIYLRVCFNLYMVRIIVIVYTVVVEIYVWHCVKWYMSNPFFPFVYKSYLLKWRAIRRVIFLQQFWHALLYLMSNKWIHCRHRHRRRCHCHMPSLFFIRISLFPTVESFASFFCLFRFRFASTHRCMAANSIYKHIRTWTTEFSSAVYAQCYHGISWYLKLRQWVSQSQYEL